MNNFRFHVDNQTPTAWEPEHVRSGTQHVHSAVARVTELRRLYPNAAIRIEREGEDRARRILPTFRFEVYVREGEITVSDDEGKHTRKLHDATILSRPFYESEREAVLGELKAQFPDAQITEVQHGRNV